MYVDYCAIMDKMTLNAIIAVFLMTFEISKCSDTVENDSNIQRDRYFTGQIIEFISPIGFLQCQKRCYAYINCGSINYHKNHLACEILKSKTTDLSSLEYKVGYNYQTLSRETLKRRFDCGKSCDKTICPERTECIHLKANKAVCVRERCKRNDYIMVSKITWCLKFHTVKKTFTDALAVCQAEGARLAIPNTEEKHRYIIDNHLSKKYLGLFGWWIGGKKISQNNWQYLNGEQIQHASGWSQIRADNDGLCLLIGARVLYDDNCNNKWSFVCEEV